MSDNIRKITILGGEGYIGSALKAHFNKIGVLVESFDLSWFGGSPSNIHIDYNKIKYFDENTDVILLAGHSSVQMCQDNTLSCYNNNIRNFISLIGKLTPANRFIYASSSSVYGNVGDKEVDENFNSFSVNNPYDLSKWTIDQLIQKTDLDYYGLRFGTVNGASPNMRADIMVNSMIKAAKKGGINITCPQISRPILGMNDLITAICLILFSDVSQPGIYNLASFNHTVDEISDIVAQKYDVPRFLNKSNSIPYDFSISSAKILSVFGYFPQETVVSICNSLKDINWDNSKKRDLKVKYL